MSNFDSELPIDAVPIVETVVEFAETVLEHGRDEYGSDCTPLFVDALDVRTKEPVPYETAHRIRLRHPDAILSNPATQQDFLRTLVGLSDLTGETRYREAAEETVVHVFRELTDDTGLIAWGGHVAHDLEANKRISWKPYHELKFHYPYYELMWEVDAVATRRYIEAFWNAHVLDWSTLDFNRHGNYNTPMGNLWENEYDPKDVFFMGDGLTFVNSGSDLYYAAGLLANFIDSDAPLEWAKRLAYRYVETRQETGISGYQFSSHRDKTADEGYGECNLRGDRAEYQIGPFVYDDRLVREGTLFKPKPQVQRRQLLLGERLGKRGEVFTEWALEELRAWAEVTYRPGENTFEPMLTDGFSMEGFVQRIDGYYGPKGTVVKPIEGHPDFLWTYAQAYRISKERVHWNMTRNIARANCLGDIGTPDGDGLEMATDTDHASYHALYGLLELHRATGDDAYLATATRVGENLIKERYRGGLFATDGNVAVVGDPVPLALLHLAAAIDSANPATVPTPGGRGRWGGDGYRGGF